MGRPIRCTGHEMTDMGRTSVCLGRPVEVALTLGNGAITFVINNAATTSINNKVRKDHQTEQADGDVSSWVLVTGDFGFTQSSISSESCTHHIIAQYNSLSTEETMHISTICSKLPSSN